MLLRVSAAFAERRALPAARAAASRLRPLCTTAAAPPPRAAPGPVAGGGGGGPAPAPVVRLVHTLMRANMSSRRQAEALVKSGVVRVNGAIVADLHARVAAGDAVSVGGGAPVAAAGPSPPALWAVHKLPGEVCARDDAKGRPSMRQRVMAEGVAAECLPVVRGGGVGVGGWGGGGGGGSM